MRKVLTILAFVACAAISFTSVAQRSVRTPLSDENREKWLSEMRTVKHDMLTRELQLTAEQQAAFFPVYDEMDEQMSQIAAEVREIEAAVAANAEANDEELDMASKALFEQRTREGQLEMEYYTKFKEILQPKQLFRLKNAERKFTQQLVKHHGRMQQQEVQRRRP